LDRFMMRIHLGYPSFDDEIAIIDSQQAHHPIESLGVVATTDEVISAQEAVKEVFVHDHVKHYIVSLVHATRAHDDAALGASPRASLALFRACQSQALLRERDYVIPDDVKELAVPVMGHRVIVTSSARMKGVERHRIVEEAIGLVAVPGGRASGWVAPRRS